MESQILHVTAAPAGWWAKKDGHVHPVAAWVAVRHDYDPEEGGPEDSIRPMVSDADTTLWITQDFTADEVWFDPREQAVEDYLRQWSEGPADLSDTTL